MEVEKPVEAQPEPQPLPEASKQQQLSIPERLGVAEEAGEQAPKHTTAPPPDADPPSMGAHSREGPLLSVLQHWQPQPAIQHAALALSLSPSRLQTGYSPQLQRSASDLQLASSPVATPNQPQSSPYREATDVLLPHLTPLGSHSLPLQQRLATSAIQGPQATGHAAEQERQTSVAEQRSQPAAPSSAPLPEQTTPLHSPRPVRVRRAPVYEDFEADPFPHQATPPPSASTRRSGSRRQSLTGAPAYASHDPGSPLDSPTSSQKSRAGTSRYRGVVWHKSNSKWEARIYENGKQRFLGYYSLEEDAARTYDEVAIKLHGSAAKLNFPHGSRITSPSGTPRSPHVFHRSAPSGGATRSPVMSPRDTLGNPVLGSGSGARIRVQPVKGSSRFRGVSWNSNCAKWRAQVWKGSEVHHLGYFEDEERAARAYDEAVLELRGANAPTNFPASNYGYPSSTALQHSPTLHRRQSFQSGGSAGHPNSPPLLAGASPRLATSKAARSPRLASPPQRSPNVPHREASALPRHLLQPRAVANRAGSATVYPCDLPSPADPHTSRFLGVSWDRPRSAWIAELWDGTEYVLLGTFLREEEAARCYDLACLRLHGSEANTNYPVGQYETELAAAALLSAALDSTPLRQAPAGTSGAAANGLLHLRTSLQAAAPSAASDELAEARHDAGATASGGVSDADAQAAAALAQMVSNDTGSNVSGATASCGALVRPPSRSGSDSGAPKSSAFKGVSWHKHSGKWYAYIQSGGRMRGLGYYDHQEQAAQAYDTEARKVHGAKAVVNFPQDGERGYSPNQQDSESDGADALAEEEAGLHSRTSIPPADATAHISVFGRGPKADPKTVQQQTAIERQLAAAASGVTRTGSGRLKRLLSHLSRLSGGVKKHGGSGSSAEGLDAADGAAALGGEQSVGPFSAEQGLGNGSPAFLGRKRSRKPRRTTSTSGEDFVAPAVADVDAQDVAAGRAEGHASPSGKSPTAAARRSSFEGVAWDERRGCWAAHVRDDDSVPLGRFDLEAEAARAVDRHSLMVAGIVANTNFPLQDYLTDPRVNFGQILARQKSEHLEQEGSRPPPPAGPEPPPPPSPPPLQEQSKEQEQQPTEEQQQQVLDAVAAGLRSFSRSQLKFASTFDGNLSTHSSINSTAQLERGPVDGAAPLDDGKPAGLPPGALQHYANDLLARSSFNWDRSGQLPFSGLEPFSPTRLGHVAEHAADEADNDAATLDAATTLLGAAQSLQEQHYAPLRRHSNSFRSDDTVAALGNPFALNNPWANAPNDLRTSRYRGVQYDAMASQWVAQVWHDGEVQQLAAVPTEEECARAYDRFVLATRGPDAQTNFPIEDYTGAPAIDVRAAGADAAPAAAGGEGLSAVVLPSAAPARGASQYKGVSWCEKGRKWRSLLWNGTKQRFLGHFVTKEEAAREYDRAVIALRGADARTNFPITDYDITQITSAEAGVGAGGTSSGCMWRKESVSRERRAGPVVSQGAGGTSQYRGVSLNKGSSKWEARIRERGRNHYLGCFDKQEDAAHAFDLAALHLRGVDAQLNFPASTYTAEQVAAAAPRLVAAGSATGGQTEELLDAVDSVLHAQQALAAAEAIQRGSSRFKGVTWNKAIGKWRAQLTEAGESRHLGFFSTEGEAVRAMEAASAAARARAAPAPPQRLEEAAAEAVQQSGAEQETGAEGKPSSRFQGVTWDVGTGKWTVCINRGQKAVYGGHYDTEEAAAEAYDQFAGKLLGEEAPLNFPDRAAAPDAAYRYTAPPSTSRSAGGGGSAAPGAKPRGGTTERWWPGPGRRSSQYKGVSWSESSLKWRAQCWNGTKVQYIGYFETEEEAARAYDRAIVELRGPGAQTNFNGAPPPAAAAPSDAAGYGERRSSAQGLNPDTSGAPTPAGSEGGVRSSGRDAARAGVQRPAYYQRGSSQYKGVSWSDRSSKWRAQLWFDNKVHHLGFFDDEVAAARAYDMAVVDLRGSTAATNFPVDAEAADRRSVLAGSRDLAAIALAANGEIRPARAAASVALAGLQAPRGSSAYRGVRWHERNNKWEARIFDGHRQVSLGYFESEASAAQAYDQEALRLRGPHAQLNFGPEHARTEAPPERKRRRSSLSAAIEEVEQEPADESSLGWGHKKSRGYVPRPATLRQRQSDAGLAGEAPAASELLAGAADQAQSRGKVDAASAPAQGTAAGQGSGANLECESEETANDGAVGHALAQQGSAAASHTRQEGQGISLQEVLRNRRLSQEGQGEGSVQQEADKQGPQLMAVL